MPDTVLYLRSLTDEATASGIPVTEQSNSMSSSVAVPPTVHDLLQAFNDVPASPAHRTSTAVLATGVQRVMLGKWVSKPLAITSLPALTGYEFGISGSEGEDTMDAFFDPVVYIKNPDLSVAGRIRDVDVSLGNELGVNAKGRIATFNGNAIGTIVVGARIVLEVWVRLNPTVVPVNGVLRINWDGQTLPAEGVVNRDDLAAYLKIPQDGLFGVDDTAAVANGGLGGSVVTASVAAAAAVSNGGLGGSVVTASTGALEAVNNQGVGVTSVFGLVTSRDGTSVDDPSEHCWGGAQPWLMYDGVEIANLGRIRNYATRLSPNLVQWGCPPNEIVYRASGGRDVFESPSTDPAPWYDPVYPESADFYGVCLEPLLDVPWDRPVTDLIGNGAFLGPLRLKAKTVVATGFLMATTARGMEYGKRWLTARTKGCTGCQYGADLDLYLSTPPLDGSNDAVGRWQLRRVGVQAIEFVPGDFPELAGVTITFAAGDPMLYKAPRIVVPFQTLPFSTVDGTCVPFKDWWCGEPDPSVLAQITPPPFGELATIITVDATQDGINGVTVDVLADCEDFTSVLRSATIGNLEQGSVFVLDSAREQATYYAPDGSIHDGTAMLRIPDDVGLPWLVVRDCDPAACLAIRRARFCSQGRDTRVQVETIQRAA